MNTPETQSGGSLKPVGSVRWRSCARWSEHPLRGMDATTTDEHDTREQAEAVCQMLRRDGLGGERNRFPLRTWVEEITPNTEVSE